jgi:hypothetical protein
MMSDNQEKEVMEMFSRLKVIQTPYIAKKLRVSDRQAIYWLKILANRKMIKFIGNGTWEVENDN